MKRQNVRTLSLIVFTFTYLLIGAAVFDALESNYEIELYEVLHKQEKYWREKYRINKTDFDDLTNLILRMKPYKAGTQWKFAGSFYFATTVITTIGYGHSTPKTNGGKIFCMLYALPGIPLCIVMFQSIGERMNTIITSGIRSFKYFFHLSFPHQVSHTSLILISSNIVLVVIISGAVVFKHYENWTYLESFYYCFITLTTIGFGDFVALQRNDTLAKRPDYVAFSLIFILFGLTVVSSVMNLLVLRFLTMNTEDERRDEIQAAVAAVHAYDQVLRHNNDISDNGSADCHQNNVRYFAPVPLNGSEHFCERRSSFNSLVSCCSRCWCSIFQKRQLQFSQRSSYSCRKRHRNNEIENSKRSHRFAVINIMNLCCLRGTSAVFPTESVLEFSQPCRKRKRYTIIRGPAKVHHLAHSNCSNVENIVKTYANGLHKSLEPVAIAQRNFSHYWQTPQNSFLFYGRFGNREPSLATIP